VDRERRDLEELQRLAVVRQLETPADEPGGLEPSEMHVDERSAQPHLTGKLAHVHAAAGEGREDPEPVRVGQRREQPHELAPRQFHVYLFGHV
jgi:hypothetical protein